MKIRHLVLLGLVVLLQGCAHKHYVQVRSREATGKEGHRLLTEGVLDQARRKLREEKCGEAERLLILVMLYGATDKLRSKAADVLDKGYETFMTHTHWRHGPSVELARYFFRKKKYGKVRTYSKDVLDNDTIFVDVAQDMYTIRIISLLKLGRVEEAQAVHDEAKSYFYKEDEKDDLLKLQKGIDRFRKKNKAEKKDK